MNLTSKYYLLTIGLFIFFTNAFAEDVASPAPKTPEQLANIQNYLSKFNGKYEGIVTIDGKEIDAAKTIEADAKIYGVTPEEIEEAKKKANIQNYINNYNGNYDEARIEADRKTYGVSPDEVQRAKDNAVPAIKNPDGSIKGPGKYEVQDLYLVNNNGRIQYLDKATSLLDESTKLALDKGVQFTKKNSSDKTIVDCSNWSSYATLPGNAGSTILTHMEDLCKDVASKQADVVEIVRQNKVLLNYTEQVLHTLKADQNSFIQLKASSDKIRAKNEVIKNFKIVPHTFDSAKYLADNPEVKATGMSAYEHYLNIGMDKNLPYPIAPAYGNTPDASGVHYKNQTLPVAPTGKNWWSGDATTSYFAPTGSGLNGNLAPHVYNRIISGDFNGNDTAALKTMSVEDQLAARTNYYLKNGNESNPLARAQHDLINSAETTGANSKDYLITRGVDLDGVMPKNNPKLVATAGLYVNGNYVGTPFTTAWNQTAPESEYTGMLIKFIKDAKVAGVPPFNYKPSNSLSDMETAAWDKWRRANPSGIVTKVNGPDPSVGRSGYSDVYKNITFSEWLAMGKPTVEQTAKAREDLYKAAGYK